MSAITAEKEKEKKLGNLIGIKALTTSEGEGKDLKLDFYTHIQAHQF